MTQRVQPGMPCQYVSYAGVTWGAVIVSVYKPSEDEQITEGTVDLFVYDPVTFFPQPARLVPYLSVSQAHFDGADARNTWHFIE